MSEHLPHVIHSHRPIAMLILGGFIAAGLVGAGCLLAKGLRDMKLADRSVTVRGVAERDVKADLALWNIKFSATGDDLAATQGDIERQKALLFSFLTQEGLEDNEMRLRGLDVRDRQVDYGNEVGKKRYIISARVVVRSNRVEVVDAASRKVGDLLKSGVTLAEGSYCGSGPSYSFTTLNDVKPEMLAAATASARKSAEQFAADSGSVVGRIRNATQGYFSIVDRDNVDVGGGEGGGCETSTPDKKVRVVTTVDYSLQ